MTWLAWLTVFGALVAGAQLVFNVVQIHMMHNERDARLADERRLDCDEARLTLDEARLTEDERLMRHDGMLNSDGT